MIAALLTLLIKLLNTPSNIQALVQLLTKMLKSLGQIAHIERQNRRSIHNLGGGDFHLCRVNGWISRKPGPSSRPWFTSDTRSENANCNP